MKFNIFPIYFNSAKNPLKNPIQVGSSPYNSVWALNILKNHYNIEMEQDKSESETKMANSKWKIRKIRNVKPFHSKKKRSFNKSNENDLKDIPENSKEDFNSIYLNEYQFPNFPKDFLQEINKFNDEVFFKTIGNFKNMVYNKIKLKNSFDFFLFFYNQG